MTTLETTLIDQLLEEQQSLTAVDRFSRHHSDADPHYQARYYQDLIPLSKSQAGEQYAFAVDLDKCTGCKACVSACHSLNGLDEEETWRDIGLIHGGSIEEPYQQTVTTACHHCLDPACANGCPVLAYEKDEATGIVHHLDDQCIGCQYCVLKCPYDVPKYNKKRGIVRKCDMCHQRLAVGEAPACVQACPSEAISIRIVEKTPQFGLDTMLPGAFASSYTQPTTSYTTSRVIPENSTSGNHSSVRLEHAHWPLVFMLVFTQAAVGIFLLADNRYTFLLGMVFLNVGLGLSVLHLGQPLKAWRAFLGWRKSWMSREIIAFSLFAGLATSTTVLTWVDHLSLPQMIIADLMDVLPILRLITGLSGILAVFTSVMIYVDTQRPFWNLSLVTLKFFGTTLGVGFVAIGFWKSHLIWLGPTLLLAVFAAEQFNLKKETLERSRAIMAGPLGIVHRLRLILLFAGFCLMSFPIITLICLLAAQIIERACFFMAASAPSMPRGI